MKKSSWNVYRVDVVFDWTPSYSTNIQRNITGAVPSSMIVTVKARGTKEAQKRAEIELLRTHTHLRNVRIHSTTVWE